MQTSPRPIFLQGSRSGAGIDAANLSQRNKIRSRSPSPEYQRIIENYGRERSPSPDNHGVARRSNPPAVVIVPKAKLASTPITASLNHTARIDISDYCGDFRELTSLSEPGPRSSPRGSPRSSPRTNNKMSARGVDESRPHEHQLPWRVSAGELNQAVNGGKNSCADDTKTLLGFYYASGEELARVISHALQEVVNTDVRSVMRNELREALQQMYSVSEPSFSARSALQRSPSNARYRNQVAAAGASRPLSAAHVPLMGSGLMPPPTSMAFAPARQDGEHGAMSIEATGDAAATSDGQWTRPTAGGSPCEEKLQKKEATPAADSTLAASSAPDGLNKSSTGALHHLAAGLSHIESKSQGRLPLRTLISYIKWFSELKEPSRTDWLAVIILSTWFQCMIGFVIFLNSITTCFAVDAELHEAFTQEELESPYSHLEHVFMAIYSAELLAKLYVHRWYFFVNDDMFWNIFDLALIVLAFNDHVMTSFSSDHNSLDTKFMRALRILRLGKALRVFRLMRFFSELRLFLDCLIGSVTSLFWTIVMMFVIFYIFSLVFVQGVIGYFDENTPNEDDRERLWSCWGSVIKAMFTLFKAALGGDDWGTFYDDLVPLGAAYTGFYVFFILFNYIAFMNILTAVFCENAHNCAEPDNDALLLHQREREFNEAGQMKTLCAQINEDGDSALSAERFEKQLEDPSGFLRTYLESSGVDVQNARVFFHMLQKSSREGRVDLESFITGVLKIKGQASSLDVQVMSCEMKNLHSKLASFIETDLAVHQYLLRAHLRALQCGHEDNPGTQVRCTDNPGKDAPEFLVDIEVQREKTDVEL